MIPLLPYLNTTVAGFFTIFLFTFYILRRSKFAKRNLAPVVGGGWPIIGHLLLLTGSQLPHIALGALADKYGPVLTIQVGLFPALVISSWEVAKELFTTNDVAVSSRPRLIAGKLLSYDYAGFGFAPYGAFWRDIRKIISVELLSNRRLELLKHVRASEVENSVKELHKQWTKNKSDSGHVLVEMRQWFGDINLNVIVQMIAGKRYFGASADEKEARRCQKAFREFFHLAGLFVLRDAVPFLGWLDFGGFEKAMKKTGKELDSIIEEWLEEHRKKRESGETADSQKDFMDVLLSMLEGMDLAGFDADTVNKATSMALISGGTDTTTVTITWALALLLNNPLVLKKAQEELDAHVGKERLVNESHINKLVYLQAIVKEVLRLYPAGPLSGAREFTEDCTVNGYHVSAGTRLIVNLWKIQRDPRLWSEPFEFRPERFLTTHKHVDVKGQHFELIPFGAGRRICPGWTFGLQMTHLVLASVIQAFEISTPANAAVDMTETAGLTNSKATPLEVMIRPRLSPTAYE
ncbi:cytochrome P450 CYP82D47-like [Tripterygium wilfordii]|uniref:cytochrome P450 CYP82D47-like n=1 Tax=Tripterygium wilfordii TaxID=458696 RepID=UPI0018F85DC2|nr:cytochrome P450 CYP82D47-like [Tripterygium wilfordii]